MKSRTVLSMAAMAVSPAAPDPRALKTRGCGSSVCANSAAKRTLLPEPPPWIVIGNSPACFQFSTSVVRAAEVSECRPASEPTESSRNIST
jgi:hypothetical protein